MLQHLLNDARRSLRHYYTHEKSSASAPVAEDSELTQMQQLLNLIEAQLHTLHTLAPSTLEHRAHNAAALHTQYQTSARQLEAAMHQLRQLGWARSLPATELAQSLTVIVLLSDLLANGQFIQVDSSDSYDLLNRNMRRATGCIAKLRG